MIEMSGGYYFLLIKKMKLMNGIGTSTVLKSDVTIDPNFCFISISVICCRIDITENKRFCRKHF